MRFRVLAAYLLIAPVASAQWHTFTSTSGQTFEGVPILVESSDVTIKRKSDRKTFTLPLTRFSAGDQKFLLDWQSDGSPAFDEPEDETPAERGTTTPTPRTPTPKADDESAIEEVDPEGLPRRLYPKTKKEIREEMRAIMSRKGADWEKRDHVKTVNRLNVYRYLCNTGNWNVLGDEELAERATAAAEACAKHGGLSHDLGHFTDQCNLHSIGDLENSLIGYMDDQGSNNRARRGHRRWCLNPPMGRTGFGHAGGSYAAMHCFDTSSEGTRKPWAYPGQGFYPKEYLHGNGWSLYLPETAPPKDRLTVEVFKLTRIPLKAPKWTEEPGRKLDVPYVSTYNNAINFEPSSETISGRGIYWVRIKGGGVREQYPVVLY